MEMNDMNHTRIEANARTPPYFKELLSLFTNITEGTSNLSDIGLHLETLGRGVRELVGAVQRLRHLGIEDLGLALPKIVVVGDQSTGKSSLIEGISDIKVPRNIGICTRCPLEINLGESTNIGDLWGCTVSLHKRYSYQGTRVRPSGFFSTTDTEPEAPTFSHPFGPWVLQDGESFPFATITSKEEVAPTLKLAQLATLNPANPYEIYMPGKVDPGPSIQVEFSPNIIRLDINGPGLPSMSFYDLPGVISVHEHAEEQYLVDLVKNLVMSYIKDEACINLLAIPMTDDPANSSAAHLIRLAKAEARTVGVLTKPDGVQNGESLAQWVQLLSDQRFRLGYGYHIVKNNPDPTVAHATARAEESVFFRSPPWSTALARYGSRFGTFCLQTFLSERLAAQIKANLPRITEQIQRKAATVQGELNLLPEPPVGNLSMVIMEDIMGFKAQVKNHIEGGTPRYPFKKDWHNIAMSFRSIMADSRPELVMPPMPNLTDSSPETPTSKGKKRPITISVDSDSDDTSFAEPFSNRPIANASSAVERPFATRFTLRQISSIIQEGHVGLPQQIDPKVTERMIIMSMKLWEKPLNQFLHRTETLCHDMLMQQISQTFRRWPSTQLYTQVVEICESFLKEKMESQRRAAKGTLQLELQFPMAMNDEAWRLSCEKARAEVFTERQTHLAGIHVDKARMARTNGKGSNGPSREEKVTRVTDEQLGPDPYSKEIWLMGIVRGYYAYAVSRFVDVICQGIQGHLFHSIRNELVPSIKEKIGIMNADADERCAALLEVGAENQERRLRLKKERDVLRQAADWLQGLTTEGEVEMQLELDGGDLYI